MIKSEYIEYSYWILIDFKDVQTHLGLFHAKRFEKSVHIYICVGVSSDFFFAHRYMISNISILNK